jgi:hypothetical protein
MMGVGVTTGCAGGGCVAAANVGVERGVMVGRAVGNVTVGSGDGVTLGCALLQADRINVAESAAAKVRCER